jgi:RHS repeat-associated protein
VTGLTNSDGKHGKLIQSYIYDAFGNILQVDSYLKGKQTVTNPYRFSTKEYNSRSGLIYFGARYYDPRVGRFVTKDLYSWHPDDVRIGWVPYPDSPFAQSYRALILERGARIPQLFHRYVYCLNNPINYIDPFGLARFGKRPLEWMPIMINDPIDDYLNLEVSHEHIFFEDKREGDIGFGPQGRFSGEDRSKYKISEEYYDDSLLREAIKNVKDGKYHWYWNNCQDWAEKVRREYRRLQKERGKVK